MKLLLSILILTSSVASFAQDARPLRFKDYMKRVAGQFGQISQVLRNKEATEKELGHVKALQNHIADILLVYPEKAVSDLDKLEYSRLMSRLMKESLKLEVEIESLLTLANGDTTAFQVVFKNMEAIRNEGHTRFRF